MFIRVPGVWSVKQSTWFCPIKVIFLSKNIHISDTHLWPVSCLHYCLWWTIPWEEATFWQIIYISNESNFQTTIYSKVWIFQSWQDLSNIGSVSPPTNPFLDAAVTRKRSQARTQKPGPVDMWDLSTIVNPHMDPQLSRCFLNLNSPNQ